MTIILDAMGSDNYPIPEIEGAILAVQQLGVDLILVGNTEIIKKHLPPNFDSNKIQIIDAPDVLEMTDKPVEASRRKPNNSMAVGLRLLKEGKGQAFVTAGNTGGALFNAISILKRMQGVQRPALTTVFPTRKGQCVVLDIGANADCRPDFFVQFGIIGSIFAKKVLNITSPRVAMLSNGEEEGKGNQLIKESKDLMKKADFNFIGNVEPKEVFAGETDVVVCDGFTGNVFLKTSEAIGKMMTDIIKEDIKSGVITSLGGLLVKPAFNRIKTMMDPSQVGAGRLLGVNGLVFIGHGRSNSVAIFNGIKAAQQDVELNLISEIQTAIEKQISVEA
ncbi:MAG: phosphate--acyl-ACP acyltransferase [Chloroflexi bacterium HGW-Chloroflexi-2]|jgi:glycerol-3-phosphate acyltransferase PlsX|nr:MAG: phosphate--acyl-ACP acyltransferase [Chloroflexi bacterium HGW-Chloroflexi-2]